MIDPKKPDLAMNFSRTEGGLVVRLNGASLEEGAAMAQAINPLREFLEARGYDPNTLRFSIRKRKEAKP